MSTKRTIVKNLLSNSIAEIANKGIAFVTTLYLTRIILADGLGVIGFANAYVIYITFFVSLGFNFVAIRDISKDKSDNNIRKYVNNITSIRVIIAIFSLLLYSIFVYFLNKPIDEKIVFFICGFNVISTAIQLDWVYQALEKMEILAIRQLFTGLLNLIGILILVHQKSDIVLAMVVTVGTLLINSIWMFILYLKYYHNFKFSFDKEFWKYLILQSYKPAIITLSITLNNYINLNIMVFLSTNEQAGFFTLAFKLFSLVMIPAQIVQVTFYPIISRAETLEQKKEVMKNYSRILFFVGSFLTIFVFSYSDFFVGLYGKNFSPAETTLKILMVTLILAYLDTINIFPLIAWKKDHVVMYANLFANILGITANLLLIPIFQANGAAIALVITELTIFIITSIYLYKEVKVVYAYKFLLFLLIAGLSVIPAYLPFTGVIRYICMIFPIIIYILLNFYFKTITINEIKGFIKR